MSAVPVMVRTLNLAPGESSGAMVPVSSGAAFLAGGNDVICPSSASAAAADRGISCLADHRYGVHLVGGGARRPYSAWAAGHQVHVVGTAPGRIFGYLQSGFCATAL
jgi:hypothetical protein